MEAHINKMGLRAVAVVQPAMEDPAGLVESHGVLELLVVVAAVRVALEADAVPVRGSRCCCRAYQLWGFASGASGGARPDARIRRTPSWLSTALIAQCLEPLGNGVSGEGQQ